MRFRRLRDISILARLGILTAFIAMAMGGNLWIARTNFARLSAALVAESLNSSMVIDHVISATPHKFNLTPPNMLADRGGFQADGRREFFCVQ